MENKLDQSAKKYIIAFLLCPTELLFFMLSALINQFTTDLIFKNLYIVNNPKFPFSFGSFFVGTSTALLLHVLVFCIIKLIFKVELFECMTAMVAPLALISSPLLVAKDSGGFLDILRGLGFFVSTYLIFLLLQVIIFNIVFFVFDKNDIFILSKRSKLIIVSYIISVFIGFLVCRLMWPVLIAFYSINNKIY